MRCRPTVADRFVYSRRPRQLRNGYTEQKWASASVWFAQQNGARFVEQEYPAGSSEADGSASDVGCCGSGPAPGIGDVAASPGAGPGTDHCAAAPAGWRPAEGGRVTDDG